MKKVFILLPDGVGLRNFAFTKFKDIGSQFFDVTYWNNTPFDLKSFGFDEVKIKNAKTHTLSDIIKSTYIRAGLNYFAKKFNDPVYKTYIFKNKPKQLKATFKHVLIIFFGWLCSNQYGLKILRFWLYFLESRTIYYKDCIKTLQEQKPSFVFCTNQRPVLAIAPLLAAQKLNIPTATFIFSWDNLPKATMIVKTDFYFVWSTFMKNELLKYYPYIKENQIIVTGTPQFEPHYNNDLIIQKEVFFNANKLDLNKKYLCFSGDDITTSPHDEKYLFALAKVVRKMNEEGNQLGIIFRRCPVDFTDRYDKVLDEYKKEIFIVNPLWNKINESWDTVLPQKEDLSLLCNVINYSELVVNIASSMVFDFVLFKKPCIYLNFDVENQNKDWSSKKVYNFIHFRSMPNKNAVFWVNEVHALEEVIKKSLNNKHQTEPLENAKAWFKIIAGETPKNSSQNIWNAINKIIHQ